MIESIAALITPVINASESTLHLSCLSQPEIR